MDSVEKVAFTKRMDMFLTSFTHVSSIKIIKTALNFQNISQIEFPLLNLEVIDIIKRMKKLKKVVLNTEARNLVRHLEKIAIFYVDKRFNIDVNTFESANYHTFLNGF